LLKEMFRDYEIHCVTIVHNPRGIQGTNFSYTHEYAFFVIPRGKKSIGHRRIDESEIDFRNLRDNGGESLRTDAKTCFYPIIVEDGKIVGFGDVAESNVHPERNVKKGKAIHVYPIDPQGIERKWRYSRDSVEEIKDLLRAKVVRGFIDIELGKDFGTYRTVWEDAKYDANEYGSKLLRDLVPESSFLFPKSLWNVYDCVYAVVSNDPNAIVMDFFGGSGTTAHAVLELNKNDGGERRFILCEQMDYVETVTKERIREVIKRNGADTFVYAELSVANQKFVEKIRDAESIEELHKIWSEMQDKAFLSYRTNSVVTSLSDSSFLSLAKRELKTFLLEILDHNMLYVPFSEIDDEQYGIEPDIKEINKKMFG